MLLPHLLIGSSHMIDMNLKGHTTGIEIQKYFLFICFMMLTHISLASFLWDISKQHSPRCDAAERGVPSGAILFAQRNFIEK